MHDWFVYFLIGGALILTAIFIVLLILIQRGKGGGLSGALGGMGGNSALGTKAGDTFTWITYCAATFWCLLSLLAIRVLNESMKEYASGNYRKKQTDALTTKPGPADKKVIKDEDKKDGDKKDGETPVVPKAGETPAAPKATETPAAPKATETPATPKATETPAVPKATETPAPAVPKPAEPTEPATPKPAEPAVPKPADPKPAEEPKATDK